MPSSPSSRTAQLGLGPLLFVAVAVDSDEPDDDEEMVRMVAPAPEMLGLANAEADEDCSEGWSANEGPRFLNLFAVLLPSSMVVFGLRDGESCGKAWTTVVAFVSMLETLLCDVFLGTCAWPRPPPMIDDDGLGRKLAGALKPMLLLLLPFACLLAGAVKPNDDEDPFVGEAVLTALLWGLIDKGVGVGAMAGGRLLEDGFCIVLGVWPYTLPLWLTLFDRSRLLLAPPLTVLPVMLLFSRCRLLPV